MKHIAYVIMLTAAIQMTGFSQNAEDPTNRVPKDMVCVSSGTFERGVMGTTGQSPLPIATVQIGTFYVAKYEVTRELWNEVTTWASDNGYTDISEGKSKGANHPVQGISWYDAVKWCNARSEKEGLTPSYYLDVSHTSIYRSGAVNIDNAMVKWHASGYRLPTEAEWEKAARGGLKGKRFPWGDTISHDQANYKTWESEDTKKYDISPTRGHHPKYAVGESPFTAPVGSFAPNGYGLYDMAGNTGELCWDIWDHYPKEKELTDPRGPDPTPTRQHRVVRGGILSFNSMCADRHGDAAKLLPFVNAFHHVGFRPVRVSSYNAK